MVNNRPARNELEVDLLPPFGKPEVSVFGDAAILGGVLVGGAAAVNILES